jgi:hypothetical protein
MHDNRKRNIRLFRQSPSNVATVSGNTISGRPIAASIG